MQASLPYSTYPLQPSALSMSWGSFPVREPPSEYLPSPPALDVLRERVRRPLAQREPSTYRRGLLDRYQPNATRYLSGKTVAHLHLMGTTLYRRHPPGTYARAQFSTLAVNLATATNRLEGVTAQDRVRQTRTIVRHAAAMSWLLHPAREFIVDRGLLTDLSAILNMSSRGSSAKPRTHLRSQSVLIRGSVYAPPSGAFEIDALFTTVVDKAAQIEDPFEQAFFMLAHLSYLHPFAESHPRTARAAANIPLIRRNLAPLVFATTTEESYKEALLAVYEYARLELLEDIFIEAYERSCGLFRASGSNKYLI